MSDPLLDNLNPPQFEAVTHGLGPLLILAGAGSGKTRVITHRIAFLLDRLGVRPYNVLAVTFTNKAAQEMRERVENILGHRSAGVQLGTFHAVCARFLRSHIEALGYKTTFTIYDSDDQHSLVRHCMKDLNIATDRFNPRAVLGTISQFKQELLEPAQVPVDGHNIFANTVARIYELYQARLKDANSLDFDDLLAFTVKLLQADEELCALQSETWKHILVDEYQDTNKAQYLMLRLLTRHHQNICVVGDDDQSIYRWRGANLANILNFEDDYPDTRVIKLEQNYRSTATILNVAHNVISRNVERKDKKLWTELESGSQVVVYAAETENREAQFVADEIDRLHRQNLHYRDIAVFYRTNAQSRALEQQFLQTRVPYTIIGGLKFYERKEIKDILAYLRFLYNPDDEVNLLRIINVPARGIGTVSIGKIRSFAHENSLSLWEAIKPSLAAKLFGKGPAKKIQDFMALIDDLQDASRTLPLDELTPDIIEATGYWEMLNREDSEQARDRIANLNELVNEVTEFVRSNGEEATLAAFLERAALVSDIDGFVDTNDRVAMMTVHSAKGLEFPVVFVTGMEEQLFPHSRSMDSEEGIEEERRLAYVGITRARERLFLTLARSRMIFGSTRVTLPSRFLSDIEPEHLDDRSFASQPIQQSHMHFSGDTQPGSNDFGDSYNEISYEPTYDAETGTLRSPIQPGIKVFHPSYGVGKVALVEGNGDNAKCTVLFPGMPMKKIVARFLQPVG